MAATDSLPRSQRALSIELPIASKSRGVELALETLPAKELVEMRSRIFRSQALF